MRRQIRLKEWGCDKTLVKQPSEKQLSIATPGLENKPYALNTDENGFIINSLLQGRSNREKCIVILGDSFIESLFIDEDKRINSVVESLAPDFKVCNAGYSGSTSLHLVHVILSKVIPLNPDYVVFFVPTNDQRVQLMEGGFWCNDARLTPMVLTGTARSFDENCDSSTQLFSVEKMLELVHFSLRNFEIPHCFGTTPHRQQANKMDSWLQQTGRGFKQFCRKARLRREVNDSCRNFCATHSLDLIDLEKDIADKNDYFYDDLHLTNTASPLVGKRVFDYLKSFNVV